MINNNCQKYDFCMESLLLLCNKPFISLLFNGYTHDIPSNQLLK